MSSATSSSTHRESTAEDRLSQLTGASTQHERPLDLTGRVVLLATDQSELSMAAAHVAHGLAERHHARIQVVSVVDTRSAPIPPPLDIALQIGDEVANPAVHEARNTELRDGISAALGAPVDWPVRTMLGTPAHAIAQEARRVHAALIVVGLRRHHRIDRATHDETALEIMRHAPCPVYGVVAGTTALPTRVLVAMDFSRTSRIAARTACAVVGEHATVVMAYVPRLETFLPDDGEREIHELGVEAGFERTARELAVPGISFDHVVLHHQRPRPTSEALLEEADASKADLIAAGSARHGRLDRWMLGSVSTELARDGRRSVLVVPPRDERE